MFCTGIHILALPCGHRSAHYCQEHLNRHLMRTACDENRKLCCCLCGGSKDCTMLHAPAAEPALLDCTRLYAFHKFVRSWWTGMDGWVYVWM